MSELYSSITPGIPHGRLIICLTHMKQPQKHINLFNFKEQNYKHLDLYLDLEMYKSILTT